MKRKWEFWYPYIISLILTFGVFKLLDYKTESKIFSEKFLELIFTTSSVLGSFLLAILALLLQTKNQTVTEIIKYKRFKGLINFNKHAVIVCFLLMIYSGLFLVVELKDIHLAILHLNIGFKHFLIYLIFLMLLSAYRYIDIFYTIISEDNN